MHCRLWIQYGTQDFKLRFWFLRCHKSWIYATGAFYYYNTEPNKNYEETIHDVVSYIKSMNIPYGYLQYDSWWYYKGIHDGVKNWTAMPSVFPNGMKWVVLLFNVAQLLLFSQEFLILLYLQILFVKIEFFVAVHQSL